MVLPYPLCVRITFLVELSVWGYFMHFVKSSEKSWHWSASPLPSLWQCQDFENCGALLWRYLPLIECKIPYRRLRWNLRPVIHFNEIWACVSTRLGKPPKQIFGKSWDFGGGLTQSQLFFKIDQNSESVTPPTHIWEKTPKKNVSFFRPSLIYVAL